MDGGTAVLSGSRRREERDDTVVSSPFRYLRIFLFFLNRFVMNLCSEDPMSFASESSLL